MKQIFIAYIYAAGKLYPIADLHLEPDRVKIIPYTDVGCTCHEGAHEADEE